MNTLNICPCCSGMLLRHARYGAIYWFCAHCRQEMPNLPDTIAMGVLSPSEECYFKD